MGEEVGAPRGYEFEILQPDGGCRSYLIADPETKQAAIVDPLREKVDDYLDILQAKRYQLVYTIETHTHADHLSGSPRLKDLTGAKILMHAGTTVATFATVCTHAVPLSVQPAGVGSFLVQALPVSVAPAGVASLTFWVPMTALSPYTAVRQ